MSLAMAFLPLLVILLLHAELFWEYCVYSLIIAALLYLGFAYLSTDQYHAMAMKAAVRLFYVVWTGFLMLVVIRRKLTEWRQGLLLVAAVVVGLLPYAYMPFASSTNPPMNWSYCSTPEGFFYAINRSQYWGTLADQLQGTVGKLVGVPAAEKQKGPKASSTRRPRCSPLPDTARSSGKSSPKTSPRCRSSRCWRPLSSSGGSPGTANLVLPSWSSDSVSLAFSQPLSYNNGYDDAGWDMQYQYQSLGYGFFVMLAGFGLAPLDAFLRNRGAVACWTIGGLAVATAIYTFVVSLPNSSQRGHWFGWMYGHDMLADLEKDSFVFGGTDPGRFVPTYMVFGESFEKTKRDPAFDRRDLYIVTQNALADTFYNRYIRSHYTAERPTTFSWFEKLLGRDKTYPEERLTFPHREEIMALFEVLMRQYQGRIPPRRPILESDPVALNSAVAEWIFLHNRDKKDGTPRHFYVEESFPMQWSYPYAIPHGLCYEINHDKLEALPPGTAEKDIAWWDDCIKKLEAVPGFRHDDLAQHSFAKLRNTGGNIYSFRNMNDAAEKAYKQALYLWPGNTESTGNLVNLYTRLGRFKDARDLVAGYLPLESQQQGASASGRGHRGPPESQRTAPRPTGGATGHADQQADACGGSAEPHDPGRVQDADATISNAIAQTPNDAAFLRDMINFYATQGRIPRHWKSPGSSRRRNPSSGTSPSR